MRVGAATLAFASIELANPHLGDAGSFILPDDVRSSPASITLFTSDVAATTAAVIAAGARPNVGLVDKPWEQTVAYALGPSSLLIEFATPIFTP